MVVFLGFVAAVAALWLLLLLVTGFSTVIVCGGLLMCVALTGRA